jgi:hypothetical protein
MMSEYFGGGGPKQKCRFKCQDAETSHSVRLGYCRPRPPHDERVRGPARPQAHLLVYQEVVHRQARLLGRGRLRGVRLVNRRARGG